MENSQVSSNISTETNTDTTVSLIPLPTVEVMEAVVEQPGVGDIGPTTTPSENPTTTTPPETAMEVTGDTKNESDCVLSNSVDIPPEENPCTSRSTQEASHLADHIPLCYALAYPNAVGLQCMDGVWHVYSAADVFIQPGATVNVDTGVVLYSNDNTAMQIDAGPYGGGRFEVQAALLSDQDFGNLWVQLSNPNAKIGVWIRKGEPIGVINFQEIRFPNPLFVDIKELTQFLAQLLETKRKKKFTTSPSHIPGFVYPSTSTTLEVFPTAGDDSTTHPLHPDERALDLSSTGEMDPIDDDYPNSEVPKKRNKQQDLP